MVRVLLCVQVEGLERCTRLYTDGASAVQSAPVAVQCTIIGKDYRGTAVCTRLITAATWQIVYMRMVYAYTHMHLCVCCLYLAVAGRADALADTSSSVDESADGQQSATTTSAAPPAAAGGGSGAASTVCGDDLQLLSCHDSYIYVRTHPTTQPVPI